MHEANLTPDERIVYMTSISESIVVVDVDGTISLRNGRGPFEWQKIGDDLPFNAVIELLNDLISLGQKLVFVSGREEFLRGETESFIQTHIPGKHELHMRSTGDNRPDEIVKLEIYNREILGKFNVRFVLDDRDRTTAMWRRDLGLPAFQVNEGSF